MTGIDAAPGVSSSPEPGPVLLAEERASGPIPRFELRDWARGSGLLAGVTGRGEGGGPGFDLGLQSAAPTADVLERWRQLRGATGFRAVVTSHQVHGTRVVRHDRRPEGWLIVDGADAHVTALSGVLLTVSVADCIPVYLVAADRGLGLVHAGWRGVAGGILAQALEALTETTGARPDQVTMHCGVGICGSCYEVGADVLQHFGRSELRGHLDLRAELARQALALGVPRVSQSPWCTAHQRESFFSHRRSQGQDGRLIAYLGRLEG